LGKSLQMFQFVGSFSMGNHLCYQKTTGGTNSDIWHYMSQDAKKPLTSIQIRAARAVLRWSAEDLSRKSSVSLRTIRRAELAERLTSLTAANDLAVRRVFEAAGVEFIDENGGGPGVRLRK
jgi:hypothetical protein